MGRYGMFDSVGQANVTSGEEDLEGDPTNALE